MADKTKLPDGPDFACIASRSALDGTATRTRLSRFNDGGMQYVDLDRGNRPEDARVVGLRTLHGVVKTDRERSRIRREYLNQMYAFIRNRQRDVKKAAASPVQQARRPLVNRKVAPKPAPKPQWVGRRDLSNQWVSSQGYGPESPGDRMLRNANANLAKQYDVAKWRTANIGLLRQYPQLERHADHFARNPESWEKFQRDAGIVR